MVDSDDDPDYEIAVDYSVGSSSTWRALILPNGVLRSTVAFSILSGEWPAVKAGLDARLAAFE
jgi:hypothetical protein